MIGYLLKLVSDPLLVGSHRCEIGCMFGASQKSPPDCFGG